jgi:hypothetical protein
MPSASCRCSRVPAESLVVTVARYRCMTGAAARMGPAELRLVSAALLYPLITLHVGGSNEAT